MFSVHKFPRLAGEMRRRSFSTSMLGRRHSGGLPLPDFDVVSAGRARQRPRQQSTTLRLSQRSPSFKSITVATNGTNPVQKSEYDMARKFANASPVPPCPQMHFAGPSPSPACPKMDVRSSHHQSKVGPFIKAVLHSNEPPTADCRRVLANDMNTTSGSSLQLDSFNCDNIRPNPGYHHRAPSKNKLDCRLSLNWPKYYSVTPTVHARKTMPNPSAVKDPSDNESLTHVSNTSGSMTSSGIGNSSSSGDENKKLKSKVLFHFDCCV